jgi:hypothetical protein
MDRKINAAANLVAHGYDDNRIATILVRTPEIIRTWQQVPEFRVRVNFFKAAFRI